MMPFNVYRGFAPFMVTGVIALGLMLGTTAAAPSAAKVCKTETPQATPWDIASVSEIVLPETARPGDRVTLDQLTIAPGETFDWPLDPRVAWSVSVASGVLTINDSPNQHMTGSAPCGESNAHKAMEPIDLTPDRSVIFDAGSGGPLMNNGTEPLVLLRMMVIPADSTGAATP